MSIINEALKKAVREKEAGFSAEDKESVRRNIEIQFHKKRTAFNWGPVFVVLVLVLITGPIVAPIFSTPAKTYSVSSALTPRVQAQNVPAQSSDIASAAVNSDVSATRKAQFGVEEAPVFGNAPIQVISRVPQLNLSGIVYSPEESYCIINNKIIKVGDFVQGAKLLNISQKSAMLEYQGKEISLSVSTD